jgi:hypothetical protein
LDNGFHAVLCADVPQEASQGCAIDLVKPGQYDGGECHGEGTDGWVVSTDIMARAKMRKKLRLFLDNTILYG